MTSDVENLILEHLRRMREEMANVRTDLRAFLGKVDTGFPKGNATNIESRALFDHSPRDFMVNRNEKRSSEIKERLGHLERGQAELALQYATLSTRMDRFSDRLERIERRLDLAEATT